MTEDQRQLILQNLRRAQDALIRADAGAYRNGNAMLLRLHIQQALRAARDAEDVLKPVEQVPA